MAASTPASTATPTCRPTTATVLPYTTLFRSAPPSTGSRSKGEEHRMTINKKTIAAAVGAAGLAGVPTAMAFADFSPSGGSGGSGGSTGYSQGYDQGYEQGYYAGQISSGASISGTNMIFTRSNGGINASQHSHANVPAHNSNRPALHDALPICPAFNRF